MQLLLQEKKKMAPKPKSSTRCIFLAVLLLFFFLSLLLVDGWCDYQHGRSNSKPFFNNYLEEPKQVNFKYHLPGFEPNPLASVPLIILSLLHVEMNILQTPEGVGQSKLWKSIGEIKIKNVLFFVKNLEKYDIDELFMNTYSHGTSPANIQSPSLSSYVIACSHPSYPSIFSRSPI